jgi:hypothetical protein
MKRVFTTCADSDLLKSNFAQREYKSNEKSLCAFSNNSRKKEFSAHKNESRLGGDGFGVNKFLFAAEN